MEPAEITDHSIMFKVAGIPNYTLTLRLGNKTSPQSKMTTLLFAFDLLKQRVGISKLDNS